VDGPRELWHLPPMSTGPTRFARVALAAASCAFLAALAVASDDGVDPAIPPGEEQVIAGMLGSGLRIYACTLVEGRAEYSVIKGTYACPAGGVAVRLDHPRNATATSTLTAQFAVTVDGGSPPPGFQEALATVVRSQERGFQWRWAAALPPADDAGAE